MPTTANDNDAMQMQEEEATQPNRTTRSGRGLPPVAMTIDGAAAAAAVPTTAVTTEDAGDATEADRALEVVRRKLTQTLSVEATVYDLINQARDEKNLALLFSGEFMIFFMFFFMFFLCVFADVSC